ncbi:MAG: ribonuclease Z [Chloroflexota bacterium]|nr:ribonuclease Z [Chloroflexota bacterium]
MLDVCLLGTGGTLPLPGRYLSSTLIRAGRELILIDCGEGTQVAMRARGWGLRHLSSILITHVHADHVLGLPGLLLTLAFTGKGSDERLTIYGPEPLEEIVRGLLVVAPRLPYPVNLATMTDGAAVPLPGPDGLRLRAQLADHDVPCLAYALELPRSTRFDPDRARALGVPIDRWSRLQRGEAVVVEGRTVEPGDVLGEPRRGLRLVLVTDTRATPELTGFVRGDGTGADLLIAEGMYASDDQRPSRWDSPHMTFAEAATMARDGGARALWLTHYGPSLTNPSAHLEGATSIFPPAELGYDGLARTLKFED